MARQSDPSARIKGYPAAALQRLVVHRVAAEGHNLSSAVRSLDYDLESEAERTASVVRPRLRNPRTKLRLEILLE